MMREPYYFPYTHMSYSLKSLEGERLYSRLYRGPLQGLLSGVRTVAHMGIGFRV